MYLQREVVGIGVVNGLLNRLDAHLQAAREYGSFLLPTNRVLQHTGSCYMFVVRHL